MGAAFQSYSKTRRNALWASEATLGMSKILQKVKKVEMAVHEWLHTQKPTPTTVKYLNLRQDEEETRNI
jgi:hypothetical protein